MSLILDALKKSEEARRRGEMPDLRSAHASSAPKGVGRFVWPAILAVALLVNTLLLLWWRPWQVALPTTPPEGDRVAAAAPALPGEPPPAEAEPVPPPPAAGMTAESGASDRASAPPLVREPSGWSDLPNSGPARPSARAVSPSPPRHEVGRPAPVTSLPHLRELPEAIRRALPELAISLHYFDPDPASRLIRLNGRILREGSSISEGLAVEEITATGVILSWQGERFRAGDF